MATNDSTHIRLRKDTIALLGHYRIDAGVRSYDEAVRKLLREEIINGF